MMKFTEPVRMQVLHPVYGIFETKAFCPLDAKMQAGMHWNLSYEEEQKCKVAVETARLGEAIYAKTCAAGEDRK